MPDMKGRITPREQVWVKHYARTGDAVYAAEKAGYKGVTQSASQNLQKENLIAAARQKAQYELSTDILDLAIARLKGQLADPKCVGQPLNRAIEITFKYGLATPEGGEEKEASEMSHEELERKRQQILREIAERSKPVTIEGSVAQTVPSILD